MLIPEASKLHFTRRMAWALGTHWQYSSLFSLITRQLCSTDRRGGFDTTCGDNTGVCCVYVLCGILKDDVAAAM
jgi:hypothetical protein